MAFLRLDTALWTLEIVCEFGDQKRQKSQMSAESCADEFLAIISDFLRLAKTCWRLIKKVFGA